MDLLVSLCLAAFVAGALNSIAGGGTLLTFPALQAAMLAALGPAEAAVVANATNTMALVPGSLAGAWGYRRQMALAGRWLLILAVPTLLGSIVGSLLVTRLDPGYFATLVPWLLLLAALLFFFDTVVPKKSPQDGAQPGASFRAVAVLVSFQFVVAIYGGYFGAGMGILMLSSLAMMGVGNIHEMNALKSILGFLINGVSMIIFLAEGKVYIPFALPMAAASLVGGYVGARLALRIRPRFIRWGVIAIAFGLAGYYFYYQ